MQETWVQSLGREDPLEEGMATQSNILAWRTPRTEQPVGPESMGSQRVGYDWATEHGRMERELTVEGNQKPSQGRTVLYLNYCVDYTSVFKVGLCQPRLSWHSWQRSFCSGGMACPFLDVQEHPWPLSPQMSVATPPLKLWQRKASSDIARYLYWETKLPLVENH